MQRGFVLVDLLLSVFVVLLVVVLFGVFQVFFCVGLLARSVCLQVSILLLLVLLCVIVRVLVLKLEVLVLLV